MKTAFFICITSCFSGLAQDSVLFEIQGCRNAAGLDFQHTIPALMAALDAGITTVILTPTVIENNNLIVPHEPWIPPKIPLDSPVHNLSIEKVKKNNPEAITYEPVLQPDCRPIPSPTPPQVPQTPNPLLSDVIVAVENHIKNCTRYEVDYTIEIKTNEQQKNQNHFDPAAFSDTIYTLIKQYLPMARIIIQSSDLTILEYWHEKYPEIRLSVRTEAPGSIAKKLNKLSFAPFICSPHYTLLDSSKVMYLHHKNIKVIPWLVNKPQDMMTLKKMGVDGLNTDYPDFAARLGLP